MNCNLMKKFLFMMKYVKKGVRVTTLTKEKSLQYNFNQNINIQNLTTFSRIHFIAWSLMVILTLHINNLRKVFCNMHYTQSAFINVLLANRCDYCSIKWKYISSLSKQFEKRFFERVIDTLILDVFFVYDFGQRGSLLCKKFQQLTV